MKESTTVSGDDQFWFTRRGVPGCEIIDFYIAPAYGHTPEDTCGKVKPRSLAAVGHVFVAALPELEKKF